MGPDGQRGRVIRRASGGSHTKLHGVAGTKGRAINISMTEGQVSNDSRAAGLLGHLPAAE